MTVEEKAQRYDFMLKTYKHQVEKSKGCGEPEFFANAMLRLELGLSVCVNYGTSNKVAMDNIDHYAEKIGKAGLVYEVPGKPGGD